jgi:hypothetical protein
MSDRPKYLSKSRFKLGYECPLKLYYTGKKQYGNTKDDDTFLRSLADGGYQVGALAKLYFPGGREIETLDSDKVVEETRELLKQENVVIFGGALRFEDLLIRADVLQKRGNQISLIEVKAKSYDPEDDSFWTKRKPLGILGYWEPYLIDVAFQTHVVRKWRESAVVRRKRAA